MIRVRVLFMPTFFNFRKKSLSVICTPCMKNKESHMVFRSRCDVVASKGRARTAQHTSAQLKKNSRGLRLRGLRSEFL